VLVLQAGEQHEEGLIFLMLEFVEAGVSFPEGLHDGLDRPTQRNSPDVLEGEATLPIALDPIIDGRFRDGDVVLATSGGDERLDGGLQATVILEGAVLCVLPCRNRQSSGKVE
jgi:hypothetical protein